MAFIDLIGDSELFERDRAALGYVPNYTRLVDVAVMDLAEQVAEDATEVTEADVQRLRDLGLSDAEIFDVVAAAAARCFFSKALDGLGTQADPALAKLDPELRDVLTVGRPIAESA